MRLIFYFVLFLSFLGDHTNSSAQDSRDHFIVDPKSRVSDSLELVHFYHETRGELWKVKWNFEQPIDQWYGVRLNSFGRVDCIDLDGMTDFGPAKNGGNHLHGVLPELDLPFLEHLFLSSNKIGGALPGFLSTPYLLTLQLSGNRFEGNIPSFFHLNNLVKLDLEFNQLTGAIPSFELPQLTSLYLGHNMFSGNLPSFAKCKNLKHLFVNYNMLEGQLPSFSSLSKLEILILRNNYFDGMLPEYFQLKNLLYLDISENFLEGCYQADAFNKLPRFYFEGNRLEICPDTKLIIPNAFSPNGDGINDTFEIEGFSALLKNGDPVEFKILNLNHQLVYTNGDYTGNWTGVSTNGKTLPEGLYIYSIRSGPHQIKGTVFIKK